MNSFEVPEVNKTLPSENTFSAMPPGSILADMISSRLLKNLHAVFEQYVSSYLTGSVEYDRSITFKVDHTRRVIAEMQYLCRELELTEEQAYLAEACALLHDIGRFEQLKKYNTFADRKSESHGCLGARVLQQNGMLRIIDQPARDIIISAVQLHNTKTLPGDLDKDVDFFTRLVRDADKLDILFIFAQYYTGNHDSNETLVHGLPDIPDITDAIIDAVIRGELADYSEVKTVNDFKVMQLGMIYDLNFIPSIARIRSERFVETIAGTLPDTEKVHAAVLRVKEHMAGKANN